MVSSLRFVAVLELGLSRFAPRFDDTMAQVVAAKDFRFVEGIQCKITGISHWVLDD
jgi:hypothetical protein